MISLTYREFRSNLKKYLDQVTEQKEKFVLKRTGKLDDVAIISKAEYDQMKNTIEMFNNLAKRT